jgi:hypothetical protein
MNTRIGIFTGLALAAGTAEIASAQTPDSPWGVAIYGGDSVIDSGSLRSPGVRPRFRIWERSIQPSSARPER